MTRKLSKLTLSIAASAVIVGQAYALDPAITNFGYVNGGGNLTIFDASDPTKIKTIAAIYGESVAISPTGAYFYNAYGTGTITQYNAYTGTSETSVAMGTSAYGMTLSPDGLKAYVASRDTDTITVINTATNTVTATINSLNSPFSITLSPDGMKAYVPNYGNSTVSVIDTATNTITATINVGNAPRRITLSADGSKVYVANYGSNTVSVINTTTNTVTETINTGTAPANVTISPDGSKVYVANYGSNTVSVINTITNTVIQTINGIDYAEGISISPDGSKIYATSQFGSFYVIDATTYAVTTYNAISTSTSSNISPFISPNLLTGTLSVASAAEMTAKGFTNSVNFAGGTLRATGSFTLSNPVYLNDAFNLTYDDSSTFTTVAGGTVDTNGYDVEFSGVVSGVGGLTKEGLGILTLSGTNTYSGGTTVTGGLVNFASADNFGSANITLNGGGLQWATGTTTDISSKLNAIGASGATFDTNSNNVTLASNLSGTGALTKEGLGILTLSGTNTYSGGTTVTGGTLKGSTTSLQGAITNDANVEFAQASDGTYASVMSGSGSLVKTGTATLTLSNTHTYTGDTDVNAGTLNITGSASSSAFRVNNGGTLVGSGTVGTTNVASGGTLYPTGTSALHVNGNLTFANGSTYKLDANPNGTSGSIVATGTANLDGVVSVTANPVGTWNASTLYTILSASSVNGTFDSVNDDLAFLTPSLSYDGTHAYLTLTKDATSSYTDVASGLGLPIATILEGLGAPNASMQTLLTLIDGMSASQAQSTFNALRGDGLAQAFSASRGSNALFGNVINSRLGALRDFRADIGLGGLRFAAAGDDMLFAKMLVNEGVLTDKGFVDPNAYDYTVWAKALGGRVNSSSDASQNIAGSHTNTYGAQLGIDKRDDDVVYGFSFGSMQSNLKSDDASINGDTKTNALGLYGSKYYGNFRVDGSATYAFISSDTDRATLLGTAKADYDAKATSLWMSGAYTHKLDQTLSLEPYVEARYDYYTQDSFSENGAGGANLSIDKQNLGLYGAGFGIKLTQSFDEKKGAFDVSVGVVKEWGDLNTPLTMKFANAPTAGSWSSTTLDKDDLIYKASAGFTYKVEKLAEIFTTLEGQTRENETSVNVSLGGRYKF